MGFKTSVCLFVVFALLLSSGVLAVGDGLVCGVYFTGVNCPHCAKAAPVVSKVLEDSPNLVLIKYEVQDVPENAPVLYAYSSQYGVEIGFPLIIFKNGSYLQGDSPIISGLKLEADSFESNACPLIDGSSVGFSELDLGSLPGKPEVLRGYGSVNVNGTTVLPKDLTVLKVVGLALADAVNPCVYAMVVLILLAIITRDPKNRCGVLLSGLAFSLAVFLIYFVYGAIIILFFKSVASLFAVVKPFIYFAVAVLAIVLGLINIRDFFSYAPGRVGSEMPIMFRPKVKKIIAKVTDPKGAFLAGAFVTLFLLPCTAGPYVILGGILSSVEFAATLPWLLFYNLIFVLPIVLITLIVYFGFSSVEKVSGWREQNIRYLHLVEGVLMLLVGVLMLLGWI
jgi:cytochrome c biogenesis protein CcdA